MTLPHLSISAVLEACTADGVFEIAADIWLDYVAFVDPSGGSSDSMTLAIAHREDDGVAVLDCVREVRAPFHPESVVEDFCQTLTSYGVGRVAAIDMLVSGRASSSASEHHVRSERERVKSDIYRDMLPLLNSRRVSACSIIGG